MVMDTGVQALAQELGEDYASVGRTLTIINRKRLVKVSDLGIDTSTANVRLALDQYFAANPVADGLDLIFDEGGVYNWANPLDFEANLHIEGLGDEVIIKQTSISGRLFRINQPNCSIANLTIDYAGHGSTCGIEVQDGGHNALADVVSFMDSAVEAEKTANAGLSTILTGLQPVGVYVRAADGVQVLNTKSENVGTACWWIGNAANTAGATNGVQRNTTVVSPSRQALISYIAWHTKKLELENLTMGEYPSNVVGGHAISFQGEGDVENPTPNTSIEDVSISKVTINGRPSVGWEQGLANGAHGDMIAVRCAKRAKLKELYLYDSGEFGIDILAGSIDTHLSDSHIERVDGCAVIDGGVNGDNVSRSVIENVTMIDSGLDQEGTPLGFSSISGLRVLKSDSLIARNNRILGSRGAAVHVANGAGFDVTAVHLHGNTYKDNGTQLVGGDAVWRGHIAAYTWDGTTFAAPTASSNTETWTGVIDGKASPNGAAGIEYVDTDSSSYGDPGTFSTINVNFFGWDNGFRNFIQSVKGYPFKVLEITTEASTSGTLAMRLNGANIGGAPNTLSTTEDTQTHTALNSAPLGTKVDFELSNVPNGETIDISMSILIEFIEPV